MIINESLWINYSILCNHFDLILVVLFKGKAQFKEIAIANSYLGTICDFQCITIWQLRYIVLHSLCLGYFSKVRRNSGKYCVPWIIYQWHTTIAMLCHPYFPIVKLVFGRLLYPSVHLVQSLYRVVGNICNLWIFMDFVCSSYPWKITEFIYITKWLE